MIGVDFKVKCQEKRSNVMTFLFQCKFIVLTKNNFDY